ncbi:MAG TPA: HPr-rel-A system PqqD family peptide chaperone [Candidatus Polarisedimenticolia bacterium]|nr:HPr-rel-A system PqqD family peptide chaperone [Candidatus Polarisedimenticolia bacterium]
MQSAGRVSKPKQINDMRERWAGKDLVLYNPRRGRMHVLNAPAATIWRLCDGSRTEEEIVERLSSEFEVGQGDDPVRDVRKILGLFLEEDLIDNASETDSAPVTNESP